MFDRARRPVAAGCLLLLALDLSGCHRAKPFAPPEAVVSTDSKSRERIVAVTLHSGALVQFNTARPSFVRNDTIHAFVGKTQYSVAMPDVQRVWITKKDAATTAFAVIGFVAFSAAVLLAIAIATKESCPFVYSWDGQQYVFDAEPYGGAITQGLERDDYGDLEHLRPDSAGLYRLLVTNEVNEVQYTNSMRLFVVDHRPGSRFAMDEHGQIHAVTTAAAPATARDQEGRDLRPWLAETDQLIWEPLPSADPSGAVRQEIVLTFAKPRGATRAQLVTRAGTGLWGSHMIREMLTLRGSAVNEWYAAIDGSSGAQDLLMEWNVREELYVLKLDVEEPDGWQTRGLLPGGGPFITEDRVVQLDVSGVVGDSVRLRIRPPSGFWALNSFAMAFDDPDRPFAVDTLAPISATGVDGRDLLGELSAPDDKYYAMPTNDDRAVVSFRAPPPREGAERTVFLHTSGYYRLNLDETRTPDFAALQRITDVPDAAARMAAESFAKRRVAAGTR